MPRVIRGIPRVKTVPKAEKPKVKKQTKTEES